MTSPRNRRFAITVELSESDVRLLRLIAEDKTRKEIAAEIGVHWRTAQNRLSELYARIGVRTRVGAALFAIRKGIVS